VDSCENVRNVYVQLFDHTVAEPVVALAVEFSHECQELLDVIVVEEVYARHNLAVNPFVVLHKLFYDCLKFFSEKSFKSMQKYCLVDVHLYVTRDNYIPTLFIQSHTSLLEQKKYTGSAAAMAVGFFWTSRGPVRSPLQGPSKTSSSFH
jgi:hypothetical protein